MHATELERDTITRYCIFAIDDETYIQMLPTTIKPGSGDLIQSTTCCLGSIARCLDGTTYMLNGDNIWVEYADQSGGGGGSVDPEVIAQAVSDWLDDHPEATTTVEDGSITKAKLDSNLQGTVDDVVEIKSQIDEYDDLMPYTIGKNKYDKATAGAQNNMCYDATTGAAKASNSHAISGKFPVEAETQYTISGTELSLTYSRVYFFSGADGSTYIGRTDSSGILTFTTPQNCTYAGIMYFARSHTDADYAAAINATQVELGSVPTPYKAYYNKRMLSSNNIVDGDAIDEANAVLTEESQINLYDKSLAVDGKYYNKGTEYSNSTTYGHTGKIPVMPNTQYNISRDPNTAMKLSGAVYQFDENGNYLRTAVLNNYVYSYLLAFTTDSDVRYIAVNLVLESHTAQDFNELIDTIMLCRGTQRPFAYVPYQKVPVIKHTNLDNAYQIHEDCFAGKKWLATGTSITWYDGKQYQAGLSADKICRGYIGYVTRRKPLSVINDGISGATLANVSSTSLINRYTTLDWANVDIATLEFGVNDFGHAITIGTAEDAAGTDTFAACLKTVIEYALTQNPKLCLVICTEPDVRGNTANSGGHYLYEYTDVTLAIAKQYRLPVCDWYYHSGINAVTRGSSSVDYLTADGTHPNDAGHLRIGAMLNQVFDSLIC